MGKKAQVGNDIYNNNQRCVVIISIEHDFHNPKNTKFNTTNAKQSQSNTPETANNKQHIANSHKLNACKNEIHSMHLCAGYTHNYNYAKTMLLMLNDFFL